MRKILFLAALLVSTPAMAHESISLQRMKEIVDIAPTACRISSKMSGGVTNNITTLVPVYTVEEKVFIYALCKLYLHGKLDGLNKD